MCSLRPGLEGLEKEARLVKFLESVGLCVDVTSTSPLAQSLRKVNFSLETHFSSLLLIDHLLCPIVDVLAMVAITYKDTSPSLPGLHRSLYHLNLPPLHFTLQTHIFPLKC